MYTLQLLTFSGWEPIHPSNSEESCPTILAALLACFNLVCESRESFSRGEVPELIPWHHLRIMREDDIVLHFDEGDRPC